MKARARSRLIAVAAVVSACSFSASVSTTGEGDGGLADALPDGSTITDAGVCPTVGPPVCVDNVLRHCMTAGAPPTDTICGWGCISTGTPHCGRLQPTGGTLAAGDLLAEAGILDKTITSVGGTIVNTDNGEITGYRGSGSGIRDGIEFTSNNGIGIFKFNRLTIQGAPVGFRGSNAVAFVSVGAMDINAVLDLRGDCVGTNPGPGGKRGGSASSDGSGSGSGEGGEAASGNKSSGGAGGGHGAAGGDGGNPDNLSAPEGGSTFGTATITSLVGGGGGGGG
ncbi:MAG: hypothetical protein M3619_13740, partial [Myxococcota bacterium]|nr:hypothetical protein [Myxococcota bacterium]